MSTADRDGAAFGTPSVLSPAGVQAGALAEVSWVLIVGAAQARIVASVSVAIREAGIEHVFCLDDSYHGLVDGAAPFTELVTVTTDDPALIGSQCRDQFLYKVIPHVVGHVGLGASAVEQTLRIDGVVHKAANPRLVEVVDIIRGGLSRGVLARSAARK